MSILNCQLKWSFALLVFRIEKSVCKLLTPEHLEVYSIIVSADKDVKQQSIAMFWCGICHCIKHC